MERSLGDHAFSRVDVSSLANPSEIIVEKVALNWTLDFEAQSIHGSVALSARVVTEGAKHICLDSRDLQILEVRVDGEESTLTLDPPHAALGVRISIPTPEHRRSEGDLIEIMISYSTSPHASAVQWLPAAATSGKEHPFVFTQSQAIHARSLFPCQDSPGVKHTYTAAVEAPSWCTVLMSALSIGIEPGKEGSRTHSWSQPVPVAPYLIALAAGDLRSSDVSERVRVWAEPSIVDAAAFEFAETETFLAAAESLTLPYAWGRYDVLCLPPSFPYGGMENPCLTFATPTLLAGDRSLADVIAHEIAHSWAGNLVTNATWEHFWLNEGLTVWLERKIVARTKGTAHALLSAQIGLQHLKDDLVRLPPDFSQLVWKLTADCDPDDAFSSVPYEKVIQCLETLSCHILYCTFLCSTDYEDQKFLL